MVRRDLNRFESKKLAKQKLLSTKSYSYGSGRLARVYLHIFPYLDGCYENVPAHVKNVIFSQSKVRLSRSFIYLFRCVCEEFDSGATQKRSSMC